MFLPAEQKTQLGLRARTPWRKQEHGEAGDSMVVIKSFTQCVAERHRLLFLRDEFLILQVLLCSDPPLI